MAGAMARLIAVRAPLMHGVIRVVMEDRSGMDGFWRRQGDWDLPATQHFNFEAEAFGLRNEAKVL
jgi:hypothetical protein